MTAAPATATATGGLDERVQARLLAEYEANVSLWQHDDMLRQQRTANFLVINTGLVTVVGIVAGFKPPTLYLGAIVAFFAIFGLLLCLIWNAVQKRNAEYIRFRRLQLREIEAQLPDMRTFQNIYRAFYQSQTIQCGDTEFAVNRAARTSSTFSEGRLPMFIGGFWLVAVAIAGVLVWIGK